MRLNPTEQTDEEIKERNEQARIYLSWQLRQMDIEWLLQSMPGDSELLTELELVDGEVNLLTKKYQAKGWL